MAKERRAVTKAAASRREILIKNLQELVENCVKLRQNVMRSGWIADNALNDRYGGYFFKA